MQQNILYIHTYICTCLHTYTHTNTHNQKQFTKLVSKLQMDTYLILKYIYYGCMQQKEFSCNRELN